MRFTFSLDLKAETNIILRDYFEQPYDFIFKRRPLLIPAASILGTFRYHSTRLQSILLRAGHDRLARAFAELNTYAETGLYGKQPSSPAEIATMGTLCISDAKLIDGTPELVFLTDGKELFQRERIAQNARFRAQITLRFPSTETTQDAARQFACLILTLASLRTEGAFTFHEMRSDNLSREDPRYSVAEIKPVFPTVESFSNRAWATDIIMAASLRLAEMRLLLNEKERRTSFALSLNPPPEFGSAAARQTRKCPLNWDDGSV
jgi:hypothetical protein